MAAASLVRKTRSKVTVARLCMNCAAAGAAGVGLHVESTAQVSG